MPGLAGHAGHLAHDGVGSLPGPLLLEQQIARYTAQSTVSMNELSPKAGHKLTSWSFCSVARAGGGGGNLGGEGQLPAKSETARKH